MDHRVLVLTFPNKNAREYFVCAFFVPMGDFFMQTLRPFRILYVNFYNNNDLSC